jgi:ubiquinone/menaquinone biosynthesis C-methylase UbiE
LQKTDYSKIASVYDDNKVRHQVDVDQDMIHYIESRKQDEYRVLDLGCGTGIYLHIQTRHQPTSVVWYGLDLSPEMIDKARNKINGVHWILGNAEWLPFADDQFDYISVNFAFHHFENKLKVCDETKRILRKDGMVKMVNIIPERIPNWWVYRLFPETYVEDGKRFWNEDKIQYEFSKRNFTTDFRYVAITDKKRLSDLLPDIRRRDTSELANLNDALYHKRLNELERKLIDEPDNVIDNEFELMIFLAKKK